MQNTLGIYGYEQFFHTKTFLRDLSEAQVDYTYTSFALLDLLQFKTVYDWYEHACISEAEVVKTYANKIRFGLSKRFINYEELYLRDKRNGEGFDLHVLYKPKYDKLYDKESLINQDSIFSHYYSLTGDDTPFAQANRFRCICGKTRSEKTGVYCEVCDSYTANREAKRGWVILKNYYMFNPDYFKALMNNLKKKTPKERLKHEICSNKPFKKDDEFKHKYAPKYNLITLQDKNVLKEFIREFVDERVQDFFINNINCALSKKLPIISKDFRHYTVKDRLNGTAKVEMHEINFSYMIIARDVDKVNEFNGFETEDTILRYLGNILNKFLDVHAILQNMLGDKKDSDLRGKTGGRRKSNSGRLIMEGMIGMAMDTCTIPYRVFGVITITPHKHIYEKYGLTPESERRIRDCIPNTFDKQMMIKVLKELQEDFLNIITVSRAPILYRESICALKVVGLTNDYVFRANEFVVSVMLRGDKEVFIGIFRYQHTKNMNFNEQTVCNNTYRRF